MFTNLSRDNNSARIPRRVCLLYTSWGPTYDFVQSQANQEASNKKNSLYLIRRDHSNETSLFLYNIDSKKEELKVIETKELDKNTCIAQLPGNKLFCFGSYCTPEIALIIEESLELRKLPSGVPCACSSAIYFNNSVYCFGGCYNNRYLALSSRFDLGENRWNKLAAMPEADWLCNSVIFNGNVLISGWNNRNIVIYSTDVDSFSIVPYNFASYRRKILINAEERLYLIECEYRSSIYESKAGDEYNWSVIANSNMDGPDQVYYSYKNREIYIGVANFSFNVYYKFNLNEKVLIQL